MRSIKRNSNGSVVIDSSHLGSELFRLQVLKSDDMER